MLWNFEDGLDGSVNERLISLNLTGLDGEYQGFSYRIDSEHSNPYHAWSKMGKPQNPSISQIENLRSCDYLELDEDCFTANGELSKQYLMPMHSVVLFILVKESNVKENICITRIQNEKGVNCNDQAFIVWNYSRRNDFKGYNLYRNGEKVNLKLLTSSCFTDSSLDVYKDNSYQIETIYAHEKSISDAFILSSIKK